MLPRLDGRPIRVELRGSLGGHHAATDVPKRLILLERELAAQPQEFSRILIHELFHFAWKRLSNGTRASWSTILAREFARGTRGELGWSAESRKLRLASKYSERVVEESEGRWRRYICESFCDTAAWKYAGLAAHDEFTLGVAARRARSKWFDENLKDPVPV